MHTPRKPAQVTMNPATLSLAVGETFPDFDLPASLGRRVSKHVFAGHRFVLYFYPKADTSGCTRQACDFEAALASIGQAGTKACVPVIGVSRDSIRAVDRFAARYGLTLPLASDLDGKLIEACGSWIQKSMYGRSYMGIDRSTFLIDPAGSIVRIWRKVKVSGHAADVLNAAA